MNATKNKTGVTAIIQARMTSSRLPGKVMKEVMGRPLLSYEIERLRQCRRIDDIIIATTVNEADTPIAAWAREEGLPCYRGSEDDVLDRYYQAAQASLTEHLMRVTGDCPLIDPIVCDLVVDRYFKAGTDYIRTGETFAEGLDCEVLSWQALAKSWAEAKLRSEREHVTLYIKNHPDRFIIETVENDTDDGIYRLTVDEAVDFEVVKTLIESLYQDRIHPFTITEIKEFLNTHAEIFTLNSNVTRNEWRIKSLENDGLMESGT